MALPATCKTTTDEDRGEDNMDPDWLIEQSIARQVAREEVLHCATLKKSIKSLPQSLRKVQSRLWQQQNCETSCCLGVLHLAIFVETCVATKWRDKLHEKWPSLTASLDSNSFFSAPVKTFLEWCYCQIYHHLLETATKAEPKETSPESDSSRWKGH